MMFSCGLNSLIGRDDRCFLHSTQLNKFFFTGNVVFKFQVISWSLVNTDHVIRSSTHFTMHKSQSHWIGFIKSNQIRSFLANATALLRHKHCSFSPDMSPSGFRSFHDMSLTPWSLVNTDHHVIRSSTHSQCTSHIGFSNWMFLANATMPLHYWGTVPNSTSSFSPEMSPSGFRSFHDMSLTPWSLVNTDHHVIRSSTHSQCTSHIGFSNWMFLANATMPLHYWGTVPNSTSSFSPEMSPSGFRSFHDMSLTQFLHFYPCVTGLQYAFSDWIHGCPKRQHNLTSDFWRPTP